MPRRARIAVVGAGWWATTAHLPALRDHPEAELVAVAEVRPEALNRAVEAFGPVKGYTDYEAMLRNESLEGVVVAVHHAAHYAVARQCLRAGLHVMLEKPMTLKAAEARRLERLAEQRRRELIIGYPYHYSPLTLEARAILHSGWLGRIQFVDCLFASRVVEFYRGNEQAYAGQSGYRVHGPGNVYADPQRSGGGQGHLQVTHAAALMLYITGLRPERVTAFMENWDVPVDLINAMSVRFKLFEGQAALGVIGSTGNIGVGGRTELIIRVFCEHGHLTLDHGQSVLHARHHSGTERDLGLLSPDDSEPPYPSAAPVHNLIEVILGQAENRSPTRIGVMTVELLEAAYRSAARQGRPVRIRATTQPNQENRA